MPFRGLQRKCTCLQPACTLLASCLQSAYTLNVTGPGPKRNYKRTFHAEGIYYRSHTYEEEEEAQEKIVVQVGHVCYICSHDVLREFKLTCVFACALNFKAAELFEESTLATQPPWP